MNENDLRVHRTRRLLREALIELASSRGYEQVTIRDITQHAQVGYNTFFRHYEGKDALLQSIVDDLIVEFQKILLPPTAPTAVQDNTLNALRFSMDHVDLIRVVLKSPVAEQCLTLLMDFALSEGGLRFGNSNLPDELVAHHFAFSMISLGRWWLEHDMPVPPEEMAHYIQQLLLEPLRRLQQS